MEFYLVFYELLAYDIQKVVEDSRKNGKKLWGFEFNIFRTNSKIL